MNILQTLSLRAVPASTRFVLTGAVCRQPLPSLCARTFTFSHPSSRVFSSHKIMAEHKHMPKEKADAGDDPHQFQAGATTDRKEDEWKHKAPYRIHDDDEKFPTTWKGGCHCGKVKYQLSREKPLASKYCHCTTCQRLHGVSYVKL